MHSVSIIKAVLEKKDYARVEDEDMRRQARIECLAKIIRERETYGITVLFIPQGFICSLPARKGIVQRRWGVIFLEFEE